MKPIYDKYLDEFREGESGGGGGGGGVTPQELAAAINTHDANANAHALLLEEKEDAGTADMKIEAHNVDPDAHAMADVAVPVVGGTATIAAVEGGKRYVLASPVNKLVVGSVAASPQESEIVFEGESYLVEATRAEFWCKDMNATWRKFTLNKVSGTGSSRIFQATFTDEAPTSYGGESEDTIYTCELKMVSGVWHLHVSWAQYPFDEDAWEVDFESDPIATGEGDLTYSTAAADTALEDLTEPDDEANGGGLPQWHAFDLSVYPRGVGIETDTDAGEYREHIELNSSAYPVTVSLPLSLDVIAMPDFQDGCYIINIRNGIAVGAEYTPGVSA